MADLVKDASRFWRGAPGSGVRQGVVEHVIAIWGNLGQFASTVTLFPPLKKPAFRLYNLYYACGAYLFLCSSGNLLSSLYQHFIHLFRYFGGPGLLG